VTAALLAAVHLYCCHQAAPGKFVAGCRRGKRDGERLAAYPGLKTEEIERRWRERVLKLDPQDPCGGTRKKAPASKRN